MRLLALVAALLLSGCVVTGETAHQGDPANTMLYSVGEGGGAGKRLIPFTTLAGYLAASGSGTAHSLQVLAGLSERQPVARQPVAVAAGEQGVYIIDAATHALYRFRWQADGSQPDPEQVKRGLAHAELTRLRILTDIEEPKDLFVAPNGDVFISDGKGRKVVRYDRDGQPLQDFVDAENLNQPVSATIDARGLRIFVADGLYDRIVVFSPQGRSLYGIGFRGDGPGGFKNIRTMVQGRDGLLYVVNGMRQQIQTYGLDGTYIASFGQGTFSEPEGIAIDDENRLYLTDRFNHRILIFAGGKLVETYGRHGTRAGEFNQPGRLAYYKGMLYVADHENSRIQVFKVVPEKLARDAAGERP
jgi:DNA-binding beta-propeller fold protein YncE